MEYLIELIERRKEIGKRPAYIKGGSLNDKIEYERLGNLVLNKVSRLYDDGKLINIRKKKKGNGERAGKGWEKMGAYCRWHDKELADVAEHEQEQCLAYGWDCRECPYFGKEELMENG